MYLLKGSLNSSPSSLGATLKGKYLLPWDRKQIETFMYEIFLFRVIVNYRVIVMKLGICLQLEDYIIVMSRSIFHASLD